MFYHAALVFDYCGFRAEARTLAVEVERGNLVPLHERATTIAQARSPDEFHLRVYGQSLRVPRPIQETEASTHKNSRIGEWFVIVMSQYLVPCTKSLGLSRQLLILALRQVWTHADIDLLIKGQPVSNLITSTPSDHLGRYVKYDDPYWRWIRFDYTFDHGGFLTTEECSRLLGMLRLAGPQILLSDTPNLEQLRRVYDDAVAMLTEAINSCKGLFMVILWEWESDDESAG